MGPDPHSLEDVVVRRLRGDEADQLRALRLSALRGAPEAFARSYEEEAVRPAAFWEERARTAAGSDRVATFVAVAGRRHVGTATCLLPDRRRPAILAGMWVEPRWRRRGLGQRLVVAACGWSAARRAPAIELVVHLENDEARLFYERAGFVPVGAPEARDGGVRREQRMSRRLTPAPPTD